MLHRGPDGAGEYLAPNLHMAMRRLAIIDLQQGWQPLYNEDNSLALIINGEIYNYLELRDSLKGHDFRTNSDGEVILHLYEERGVECLQALRGMFAFALWDAKLKRLFLARDRMGEKPLYLYEDKGRIIFASELKALLSSGLVPFRLNPQAVHQYFHYQYVPDPSSPLQGVRKLPPAHALLCEVDGWRRHEWAYWRMEDAPPLPGDPVDLLCGELEGICDIVHRSDVPVGIALSGGLDSSLIAALTQKRYPGTMHAFSVGYAGAPPVDERGDARDLASHLGMPYHEVEIAPEDVRDFFPELNYWRDEPVADISGHGYYAVMRLAADHGFPVMLMGHGGDELFWGYSWIKQAALESLVKKRLVERGPGALLAHLRMTMPLGLSRWQLMAWLKGACGLRESLARMSRALKGSRDRLILYDTLPDFADAEQRVREFYTPAFRRMVAGDAAYAPYALRDTWSHVLINITKLICRCYLVGNGILQGDRLSMASSVELRLPLVDYRLVETAVGLRKARPDLYLPGKEWLRQAAGRYLPDWVLNRRKRGFQPPMREWEEAVFRAYGDSLRDGYLVETGILDPAGVERLLDEERPRSISASLAYKSLVLEQWCRAVSGLAG